MNLSDMKVIAGLPQMVGRATSCAPRHIISGVQRTARPTAQRFFNIECVRDQDGSTLQ
jgi:hypothetical protein